MLVSWYCRECGFRVSLDKRYFWRCPRCGSPLDIEYRPVYEYGSRGLDRFRGLLPISPLKYIGEGETKIIIEKLDGVEVVFKLEYSNPSGSFKDRGTALAISYAYTMGYKEVVEDSSGNTGISVALYSRIYKLRSRIVIPKTTSREKKCLMRMFGAELVEVPTRGDAANYVLSLISDAFYVAHTWSPLYIYGASTISFEVYEDYGVPDVVMLPVGSGGLLLGVMKGFEILNSLGKVSKIPRPVAIEGYSVQPVFKVVKGYEEKGEDSSLAEGIMVPNPPRLNEVKNYIDKYGGDVTLVGNSEIIKALEELLDLGFVVEPTSATAYAAFKKYRDRLKGLKVLIVLTGSGLKMCRE
jgi:threonine synthase